MGSLAALTSNFFFGQGMWTPWQMYAWGLVGYLGGVLADAGAFSRADGSVRNGALIACGAASALSICRGDRRVRHHRLYAPHHGGRRHRPARRPRCPFDLTHAAATVLFLRVLYAPWMRRIDRVVRKYALRG